MQIGWTFERRTRLTPNLSAVRFMIRILQGNQFAKAQQTRDELAYFHLLGCSVVILQNRCYATYRATANLADGDHCVQKERNMQVDI